MASFQNFGAERHGGQTVLKLSADQSSITDGNAGGVRYLTECVLAPQLSHSNHTIVTQLSHNYHTIITQLLHNYHTIVTQLPPFLPCPAFCDACPSCLTGRRHAVACRCCGDYLRLGAHRHGTAGNYSLTDGLAVLRCSALFALSDNSEAHAA